MRKTMAIAAFAAALLVGVLSACATDPGAASARRDWPAHGLNDAETRFSPLAQVSSDNVSRLGLAWSYDLQSTRGVEATPLVVDGVMFVTASWSVVHAIDARSGQRLWTYDPQVPRSYGMRACCDVVNRGVAYHQGKVFVGALDGRLVAIDAKSGRKAWEVDTRIDTRIDTGMAYTITGAPRVVKGKVIIGNGGAEYGVRGYVTAYDAASGRQAWRWFTVPGDPSKPFEDESMARAAKTWDPSAKYWEAGGGGTVWDSMAFDAELNLLYVGTGNGSPWSRRLRSPAGGDNLYLSSIVALDADTGRYVWHYQETPGDNWDYTATQHIVLADLPIDGVQRKVLLHAPKNGFFFVIDRRNGRFISAKNFVPVNWASGYTPEGRPIEAADARGTTPMEILPGPAGGHNWHPMSFNPQTGLVYIPAQTRPTPMVEDPDWKHNVAVAGQLGSGIGWNLGMRPGPAAKTRPFGRLIAWDPIAQKEVWRQEHAHHSNGGTLSTAGNLVFQGTSDGRFGAWNARTGEKLWESPVGLGIIAAPVTFELDGRQYVSIAAGWGGGGFYAGVARKVGPGTVFTFALDARTPLPEFADSVAGPLLQGVAYDPAKAREGMGLYLANCVVCHGVPAVDKGGNLPNLGRSHPDTIRHLDKMIFNGPYGQKGMPDFSGKLSLDDVEKLKAFIQGTADQVRAASAARPKP